jgi:hypothetical protein
VEIHCLLPLLRLDVIAQTDNIINWIASLLHLHDILCRNKARSGGGVVASSAIQGYPMGHAVSEVFFSIKYRTKIQINSFSYPKV